MNEISFVVVGDRVLFFILYNSKSSKLSRIVGASLGDVSSAASLQVWKEEADVGCNGPSKRARGKRVERRIAREARRFV